MANVAFEKVNKIYGNGFHAVKEFSLEIKSGEFLILVGPSGCGKSTALRMIAGLEDISSGDLLIGERSVVDVAPKDRDIAMVFQNYALYPHMNVYDNIAFALKLARFSGVEVRRRVGKVASILELEQYLQSKPAQLSGGQRQRVAMGRAMVREPAVFLMDEPLSNLDAKLRVQMRAEIVRLQRELRTTTIYVTHDQIEAMTMGDRVAVLKDGILQQVDTPSNLYKNPKNVFVAGFIGSPAMNIFKGSLENKILKFGKNSIELPEDLIRQNSALKNYNEKEVIFGFRPEHLLEPLSDSSRSLPLIKASVRAVEELGNEHVIHMEIDAPLFQSELAHATDAIGIRPNTIARFDPNNSLSTGMDVNVSIDPDKIHFFDPFTEEKICSTG
tara:strand:- start:102 stop:1259 length:1158 start_codon:yes stop_codon:yes gene_type:complete